MSDEATQVQTTTEPAAPAAAAPAADPFDAAADKAFAALAQPKAGEEPDAPETASDDRNGDEKHAEVVRGETGAGSDAEGGGKLAENANPLPAEYADREKFVLAKRALARDGWTEEEINALKPDLVVSKGQKAKERQDSTDRIQRDMLKYKAQARGKAQRAPEAGQDDSAGRSGDEVESAELDGAERQTDSIDELVEQGLVDPSAAPKLRRTMAQRIEAEQEQARAARMSRATAVFQGHIDRLVTRHPALKDAAVVQKVTTWMARHDPDMSIALGDDTQRFTDLINDAIAVEVGADQGRQQRISLVEGNKKTRDSQPELAGVSQTRKAVKTNDQYMREVFDAGTKVNSPEEFNAAISKIPKPVNK